VLVLAIVALLVPLGVSLRDRVDAEVRLQARAQSEVVAARAAPDLNPVRVARLTTLARRAARSVRGRVLIVDQKGAILADSSGIVPRGTSYAGRPEIATALSGNVAQVRRDSQTLGQEILATAAPVLEGGKAIGAVRVTQSVAAVNRAVRRTWLGLGLIGLVVLALGLLVGALVARLIARPIVRLEQAAQQVADGDLDARAVVEGTLEQRTLSRTFNAMTERLVVLLSVQRQFVADASHQLRTPLTGLRLRLEAARGEATTAQQETDLDAAIGEVDRLTGIVNGLLELSQAGEERGSFAADDPAAAVRRAVERFEAPAAIAGCDILADTGPAPGTPVMIHPRDLDRILDVLIENAISYAPGEPIELDVDGPIIRVRDHGPGLSEGEAEAVFARFHRGRAGVSSGAPGTGIGLAIARDLVRRWDGDVVIGGAPGGGAIAEVELVAVTG
jgi:signal transduction histidine kinase